MSPESYGIVTDGHTKTPLKAPAGGAPMFERPFYEAEVEDTENPTIELAEEGEEQDTSGQQQEGH